MLITVTIDDKETTYYRGAKVVTYPTTPQGLKPLVKLLEKHKDDAISISNIASNPAGEMLEKYDTTLDITL